MSKLKKIGLVTTGLILAMNLISTGGVAKSLGLYMSESTNSDSNYQQTFIINQTYGGPVLDYAYSVIATSDEGYVLAGYTRSYGAGKSDMWLVKTNAAGQVEWNQTIGGTAADYAFSVRVSSDGGYVLAGGTESYGAGKSDMWLVKTNAAGQVEWNQTIGGSAADYAFPVIASSDAGYVLAGRTESYGAGESDMWLVKTNAAGQVEWNQTFGGVDNDDATSVIATSDAGYLLAGGTESYGTGGMDMWLVKTNAIGQHEWNQTYGGLYEDRASTVIATSDGGYVIAGLTSSYGAGSRDMWLVKTSATGQHEWNQTYGGTGLDYADSVVSTSDGGYVLAGRTESYGAGESDMWLVKTNAAGQVEWSQTFGGIDSEAAYSVIATSDEEYVLVGRTESYGAGNEDIWLIKIDIKDDFTETTSFPAFEVILFFIIVLIVNSSQRKSR
ncbi:MAG: hypothetical protein ACFE95_16000 [Candidatus Hodarchaeota archaeon]